MKLLDDVAVLFKRAAARSRFSTMVLDERALAARLFPAWLELILFPRCWFPEGLGAVLPAPVFTVQPALWRGGGSAPRPGSRRARGTDPEHTRR